MASPVGTSGALFNQPQAAAPPGAGTTATGSIWQQLAQLAQQGADAALGAGAAGTTLDPAAQLQAIMKQITTQNASTGTGRKAQWYDSIFEHYLGHLPTPQDEATIAKGGWNYDRLVDHLRAQPSYIKGMTIGAVEDMHKSASNSFMKWTGREATDSDIKQLANQGITSEQDIEKYISNRADVVAAHPGAPLGLGDVQWGQHKAAINSQFQANLGKDATDQEARDAYAQAASPFRRQPAEQVGLGAGIKQGPSGAGGALMSEAQIAPNARNGGF